MSVELNNRDSLESVFLLHEFWQDTIEDMDKKMKFNYYK